jgi:hypothetical protein
VSEHRKCKVMLLTPRQISELIIDSKSEDSESDTGCRTGGSEEVGGEYLLQQERTPLQSSSTECSNAQVPHSSSTTVHSLLLKKGDDEQSMQISRHKSQPESQCTPFVPC